jgi:uncharacterized membrane protein YedE/YeeE
MILSDLILALIGGALIGLSATLLMMFNGRIAGISGIVSGALFLGEAGDRSWRVFFILGLLMAPLLYGGLGGDIQIEMTGSPFLVVIAGLLVGFGTRLGSGCTSGHGVCGLSRLSPRSLAATMLFMITGMVTVSVMKLWVGV